MPTTYERIDYGSVDGAHFGGAATDKIAFYGFTPVTQRAAALQSGSGVSATSTDWGTTQAAWAVEVTATLTGLGLWKGAA